MALNVDEADDLTPLQREVADYFRRNFSRFYEPDFVDAVRRFFSKATFCRPYSVSVGTAPVQLVAYNPSRIRVSIFNNGGSTIFYGRPNKVAVGSAGAPDAGFPLLSNTGIIIDDSVAEIWGVSSGTGIDVRIEDVTTDSV